MARWVIQYFLYLLAVWICDLNGMFLVNERGLITFYILECAHRQKTCKTVEWKFPSTSEEKLRYKTFKDFWERGHYLSSGSNFGGDFLVYPGDPSRFHSFFIAICKPHDEDMSALDIITMGRLGTSVKKTVVICSEDRNGELRYTSLQWTGIS